MPSSLKSHGADDEVAGMFEMGEEMMKLPLEEKLKFEQGDGGRSVSAGYAIDSKNTFPSTFILFYH